MDKRTKGKKDKRSTGQKDKQTKKEKNILKIFEVLCCRGKIGVHNIFVNPELR